MFPLHDLFWFHDNVVPVFSDVTREFAKYSPYTSGQWESLLSYSDLQRRRIWHGDCNFAIFFSFAPGHVSCAKNIWFTVPEVFALCFFNTLAKCEICFREYLWSTTYFWSFHLLSPKKKLQIVVSLDSLLLYMF